MTTPTHNLDDLIKLMQLLRQECPWDKKQSNRTLVPYLLEEAYELAQAIYDNQDNRTYQINDIKDELGDVLLQVVFHSVLYEEQGHFGMGEVILNLQEKLIRRHPHVFEKQKYMTSEQVKARWNEIKTQENRQKHDSGKPSRTLDAIKAQAALMQALQLQKAAACVGFDWDNVAGAWDKLKEEMAELEEILPNGQLSQVHGDLSKSDMQERLQDELGDCLFSLVNVARKLEVDPEVALLGVIAKFKNRFGYIEDELGKMGKSLKMASLDEMNALWERAKLNEDFIKQGCKNED